MVSSNIACNAVYVTRSALIVDELNTQCHMKLIMSRHVLMLAFMMLVVKPIASERYSIKSNIIILRPDEIEDVGPQIELSTNLLATNHTLFYVCREYNYSFTDDNVLTRRYGNGTFKPFARDAHRNGYTIESCGRRGDNVARDCTITTGEVKWKPEYAGTYGCLSALSDSHTIFWINRTMKIEEVDNGDKYRRLLKCNIAMLPNISLYNGELQLFVQWGYSPPRHDGRDWSRKQTFNENLQSPYEITYLIDGYSAAMHDGLYRCRASTANSTLQLLSNNLTVRSEPTARLTNNQTGEFNRGLLLSGSIQIICTVVAYPLPQSIVIKLGDVVISSETAGVTRYQQFIGHTFNRYNYVYVTVNHIQDFATNGSQLSCNVTDPDGNSYRVEGDVYVASTSSFTTATLPPVRVNFTAGSKLKSDIIVQNPYDVPPIGPQLELSSNVLSPGDILNYTCREYDFDFTADNVLVRHFRDGSTASIATNEYTQAYQVKSCSRRSDEGLTRDCTLVTGTLTWKDTEYAGLYSCTYDKRDVLPIYWINNVVQASRNASSAGKDMLHCSLHWSRYLNYTNLVSWKWQYSHPLMASNWSEIENSTTLKIDNDLLGRRSRLTVQSQDPPTHQGAYRCIATVKNYAQLLISDNITVRDLTRAILKNNLSSTFEDIVMGPIEYTCDVYAYPKPQSIELKIEEVLINASTPGVVNYGNNLNASPFSKYKAYFTISNIYEFGVGSRLLTCTVRASHKEWDESNKVIHVGYASLSTTTSPTYALVEAETKLKSEVIVQGPYGIEQIGSQFEISTNVLATDDILTYTCREYRRNFTKDNVLLLHYPTGANRTFGKEEHVQEYDIQSCGRRSDESWQRDCTILIGQLKWSKERAGNYSCLFDRRDRLPVYWIDKNIVIYEIATEDTTTKRLQCVTEILPGGYNFINLISWTWQQFDAATDSGWQVIEDGTTVLKIVSNSGHTSELTIMGYNAMQQDRLYRCSVIFLNNPNMLYSSVITFKNTTSALLKNNLSKSFDNIPEGPIEITCKAVPYASIRSINLKFENTVISGSTAGVVDYNVELDGSDIQTHYARITANNIQDLGPSDTELSCTVTGSNGIVSVAKEIITYSETSTEPSNPDLSSTEPSSTDLSSTVIGKFGLAGGQGTIIPWPVTIFGIGLALVIRNNYYLLV